MQMNMNSDSEATQAIAMKRYMIWKDTSSSLMESTGVLGNSITIVESLFYF